MIPTGDRDALDDELDRLAVEILYAVRSGETAVLEQSSWQHLYPEAPAGRLEHVPPAQITPGMVLWVEAAPWAVVAVTVEGGGELSEQCADPVADVEMVGPPDGDGRRESRRLLLPLGTFPVPRVIDA